MPFRPSDRRRKRYPVVRTRQFPGIRGLTISRSTGQFLSSRGRSTASTASRRCGRAKLLPPPDFPRMAERAALPHRRLPVSRQCSAEHITATADRMRTGPFRTSPQQWRKTADDRPALPEAPFLPDRGVRRAITGKDAFRIASGVLALFSIGTVAATAGTPSWPVSAVSVLPGLRQAFPCAVIAGRVSESGGTSVYGAPWRGSRYSIFLAPIPVCPPSALAGSSRILCQNSRDG